MARGRGGRVRPGGTPGKAIRYTIIETARANGIEPMHYRKFLFNCIERFCQDKMPWERLLPTPAIRTFADSVGIPCDMVS